jgi:hypothetical protein
MSRRIAESAPIADLAEPVTQTQPHLRKELPVERTSSRAAIRSIEVGLVFVRQ